MDDEGLLVLGLLTDVLLPGEERVLAEDALEAVSLKRLQRLKPSRLLALPIDFALQLPSYVGGRIGVIAEVLSLSRGELRVRGLERARVESIARGEPFAATVERLGAPSIEVVATRLASLARERAHDESSLAALRAAERALATHGWLLDAVSNGESASATASASDASPSETSPTDVLGSLRARLAAGLLTTDERRRLAPIVGELARGLGVGANLSGRNLPAPLEVLERRLDTLELSEAARRLVRERLVLLADMPKNAHDYHTYVAHLELLASLPWGAPPPSTLDLDEIERRLEQEHHGLGKAKRRIVEHLAVRALGGSARGMVLCLAGPPGVGKTSIARSIATGLDRPLVRVPLGGVHDECEIRGHRQSFHAASPGRIVAGMRQAGRVDPVMLLDEIDKIGKDSFRSPAAALLEVLDPEQHHAFGDNFLGAPYDLSKVLFIATANELSAISRALRDRMEVIELDGYTLDEKAIIAEQHLLPRLAREHGLSSPLPAPRAVLLDLIEQHTREPGVRELERALASLHRARAVERMRKPEEAEPTPIEPAEIARVLGPPRHRAIPTATSLGVGAAHGLSVSGDGAGAILPVEVLRARASGRVPSLHLTGSLGDVLRESARAALSRLHAEADALGIHEDALSCDLHVHLPEGAVKKDGPSAGVAVYLALRSALTGVSVRGDVAWTGEISLHGAVLPVGGVRAKVLAAERAGLALVVIPEANRADVPDGARISIRCVAHVHEAAEIAFERAPVADALPGAAG